MNFKIEKKGYSPQAVDAHIAQLKSSNDETLLQQKQRIQELKNQLASVEKEVRNYKEKSSLVSKAILNAVSKADEIERLSQIKYNQEINQLKAFHDKWTEYYNKILDRYPLDDQLIAAGKFNSQMTKILSRANPSAFSTQPEDDTAATAPIVSEQQIGYIRIKTEEQEQEGDDGIMQEMVPGADLSSPIMSGNYFDPLERINRYFAAERTKSKDDTQKRDKRVRTVSPASKGDYADRLPSGFSFEEAMNPKEDLSDIMRDLGLLLDE